MVQTALRVVRLGGRCIISATNEKEEAMAYGEKGAEIPERMCLSMEKRYPMRGIPQGRWRRKWGGSACRGKIPVRRQPFSLVLVSGDLYRRT